MPGTAIGLGSLHRTAASLRLGATIDVAVWEPTPESAASTMSFDLAYIGKGDASSLVVDVGALVKALKLRFSGHVYMTGQQAALQFEIEASKTITFKLTCTGFETVDVPGSSASAAAASGAASAFGQLLNSTEVQLTKASDQVFRLKGGSST